MMADVTRRERPLLIYDGDCGFCTSSAGFIGRRIPTSAEIVAFQSTDLDAIGTTGERAAHEVLWADWHGDVFGGAQAVAKLLMDAGGAWWPLGALVRVPPFRWVAHGLYRLVAANRHRMPGRTAACGIPADRRP
jgi:predicted DCC family thiol-disulfide oxidoreductase YuxK